MDRLNRELRKMDNKYGLLALIAGGATLYFARKQGRAQGAGIMVDVLETEARKQKNKSDED